MSATRTREYLSIKENIGKYQMFVEKSLKISNKLATLHPRLMGGGD